MPCVGSVQPGVMAASLPAQGTGTALPHLAGGWMAVVRCLYTSCGVSLTMLNHGFISCLLFLFVCFLSRLPCCFSFH